MLNPFPELLVYGFFAPLLLRVILGTVLLYLSVEHFRARKEIAHILSPLVGKAGAVAGILFAVVEIATGALLVVGAWTQVAALVAAGLSLKSLFVRGSLKSLCPLSKTSYLLTLGVALSLCISGAGGLAFDLPL